MHRDDGYTKYTLVDNGKQIELQYYCPNCLRPVKQKIAGHFRKEFKTTMEESGNPNDPFIITRVTHIFATCNHQPGARGLCQHSTVLQFFSSWMPHRDDPTKPDLSRVLNDEIFIGYCTHEASKFAPDTLGPEIKRHPKFAKYLHFYNQARDGKYEPWMRAVALSRMTEGVLKEFNYGEEGSTLGQRIVAYLNDHSITDVNERKHFFFLNEVRIASAHEGTDKLPDFENMPDEQFLTDYAFPCFDRVMRDVYFRNRNI